MREIFTYGSVGGAPGNRCFYPEEGPGLLRGLSGVPGSGKFKLLSELFGFKKPSPSAPRYHHQIDIPRTRLQWRWKVDALGTLASSFPQGHQHHGPEPDGTGSHTRTGRDHTEKGADTIFFLDFIFILDLGEAIIIHLNSEEEGS